MLPERMTQEERSRFDLPTPTAEDISQRLVVDAQALLIRASLLAMASDIADDMDVAFIVARAATEVQRIAVSRPAEQYVQSHAFARADATLEWLPESGTGESYDMTRLALYMLALIAIAEDMEERIINPNNLMMEFNRGFPPRQDDSAFNYKPPKNTFDARDRTGNSVRMLLSKSGVSTRDIELMEAAFADQSLGGVKYIIELRNRLTKDDAP
ncbi:MAG: hypothetical protein KF757_02690 [Phycisphaeraceae bacterium]|nr:hypothetical protein [Phycisphaeraceae bacterium]MCW5764279.1 hypothetical protein [Phycisphaeraceae bacterium]